MIFQTAVSLPPADPYGAKLRNSRIHPPARRHPAILRVSALGVAGILSALMVTAVVPPIVADQSDRAVVNAPVTLLTAPIGGEISALTALPGSDVRSGDRLARIENPRLDRGTLISLEEKSSDAREKLNATQAKRESDGNYVASLDAEIASQTEQLRTQFQSQIEELRARVAQSNAVSGEKKALVDRQNNMVARDTASTEMVKPTALQYTAALHSADAETARLNQKIAQLDALNRGVYVGDDLVAINNLAQKRRDIDLDGKRMQIEEKEQSAVLADLDHLIDVERRRLESLAAADVRSTGPGKVLTVGAAMGRHVSAGDTIASVIDCDKPFVVAIFSYRQGQSMRAGTRVHIDGASFRTGIVNAVLPKTSDKTDERFAVPFPQTERRELYAVITPDGAGDVTPAAETSAQTCPVGQWATVTRDNGIVPSMSVTWRRLGNLVASLMPDSGGVETARNSAPNGSAPEEDARRAGIARLEAAFRSPSPQAKSPDGERRQETQVARLAMKRTMVMALAAAILGVSVSASGTAMAAGTFCDGLSTAVTPQTRDADAIFIRSYQPGSDEASLPAGLASSAFVYDNALAAIALVACGNVSDAKPIGNALSRAVRSDRSFNDGRIRNAYRAGAVGEGIPNLPGWWDGNAGHWAEDSAQDGTSTGNVAWAALALLTLHQATQDRQYLADARRLIDWGDRANRLRQCRIPRRLSRLRSATGQTDLDVHRA